MHPGRTFLTVAVLGSAGAIAMASLYAGRRPPQEPPRLPTYALGGTTYLVVDQHGAGALGIGTVIADTADDGAKQVRTKEQMLTGANQRALSASVWRYTAAKNMATYTWNLKRAGREVSEALTVDAVGDGRRPRPLSHPSAGQALPTAPFLPGPVGAFVLAQHAQDAVVRCRARRVGTCADSLGGKYARLRDWSAVRSGFPLETQEVSTRPLDVCAAMPTPAWLIQALRAMPAPYTCLLVRHATATGTTESLVSLDAAGRLLRWRERNGLDRIAMADSAAAVAWGTRKLTLGRLLTPTEVSLLIGLR